MYGCIYICVCGWEGGGWVGGEEVNIINIKSGNARKENLTYIVNGICKLTFR